VLKYVLDPTGHGKGAPGLAFETWDPPSKGQSSSGPK
jgi:hypothetical protein